MSENWDPKKSMLREMSRKQCPCLFFTCTFNIFLVWIWKKTRVVITHHPDKIGIYIYSVYLSIHQHRSQTRFYKVLPWKLWRSKMAMGVAIPGFSARETIHNHPTDYLIWYILIQMLSFLWKLQNERPMMATMLIYLPWLSVSAPTALCNGCDVGKSKLVKTVLINNVICYMYLIFFQLQLFNVSIKVLI